MTIARQTGPGVTPPESRPVYKPRLSRDEFFMAVAKLYALRSTCVRGQVGCIAVKDSRQIAAGYNGAPPGMAHCVDVGCGGGVVVDERHLGGESRIEFPNGCTRSIHAEVNMVAHAARVGVSLEGATVFTTAGPCLPCAQVYVAAGIARLVYETPYRLPEGLALVDKACILIERYLPEVEIVGKR